MNLSDKDPTSFTNLRESEVIMPGGGLDNSSSMIYDDDIFDDGQNTARIDLQQQYHFALESIRQLRQRLVRRTNTIEEIRRYYLRDIVTMKLVIREILTDPEREKVWQQYDDVLPSLDLKDSIRVHAPHGYEFTIKPCEMCGGQLELIKKDTDQVEALRKALRDSKERENKWREKLAVLDTQVESVGKERAETTKSHMEEKRVLYEELKKLNDIIGKLKEDREKILSLNKKYKEENETVKKRNEELEVVPPQLVVAEKENEILKGNLQSTQEQLKTSKSKEKALQKDLLDAQDRVKDLEGEIETAQQELVLARQDCKQQELAMSRIRDMSSELEHSLDVVNREKLELTKRISELEEEAEAMRESQTRAMRDNERAIDQLRHDLREAQKTHKFSSKEQEKLVRELEICKETIGQLTELNKNQELELLDNAEEIQLFEQEIVAMQQFIRDKVAVRTYTVDSDANAADSDLPNILKVLEGVIGNDDNEDAEDINDPSGMSLKREVSALSADDDSVGSGGSTGPLLGAASLKSRHKALKSKRSVRQVNKAETEKKNQLLLKQASERLKPIDFGEASDEEDEDKQLLMGEAQDDKDEGESDEEGGDKKKTPKSAKKKKPNSGKSKSKSSKKTIQGGDHKKKNSDTGIDLEAKPHKLSIGSKPSTPLRKSRGSSAHTGSDTENTSRSVTPINRSALSSAEGKRPHSREGPLSKAAPADAPKMHGRAIKKRVTSIKNSQVGELLEKAAQVAQEVIVIEEDEDEAIDLEDHEQGMDGIAMKPSEMMALGIDDDGDADEEVVTDNEDTVTAKKSSKSSDHSKHELSKDRNQKFRNPTIPEDAEVIGPMYVHFDMPVVEAAAAVSMASEVLSEIGIEPPSVASVLEKMLLTENQPKEVFVGVPNAKVEMKRMESVRRRKSIPKDFNFNAHILDDAGVPPPPLVPLGSLKDLNIDAPQQHSTSDEAPHDPDASARTTPSLVRDAKERVEKHSRQHKQTKELIDSAKDRLKQIRSLFDAPQNIMHANTRGGRRFQEEEVIGEKSPEAQPMVIPRGPKLKGEDNRRKSAPKPDATKKPPAPTYVVEDKKHKPASAAAKSSAPIKPVHLLPPPIDATKLELSLRDQLLSVLNDATASGTSTSPETVLHLNKNSINCAMNVMTPILHQFSRMLNFSIHSMWESLMFNRNSLDFYQKALVVFDGIVQCAAEDTTNSTVAEICAKLVPIAGSTYNSSLTTAWQKACCISPSIIQDLTPVIVNYDTNERRSKTYEEFLQSTVVTGATSIAGDELSAITENADQDQNSLEAKLDDASSVMTVATSNTVFPLQTYEEKLVTVLETVEKMQSYGETIKDRLNEDMVEVLREWSTSKTVHLELDERLELERDKVRRAGELKLAAVAKELAKVMAMNEKTQERLRDAEIKLKDIPALTAENQRAQQSLAETKEKLDTVEIRLADRIKDYHDLQRVSTVQYNKISNLESTLEDLEQQVTTVSSELQTEKLQKMTLDEYLRTRTAERDRLNESLVTMMQQEHQRLNSLHDVEIQYEPDNVDHQVQTEFLTVPMNIKTILHHKQGQNSYAKFPLVYSQAIDVATSKPGTASLLMNSEQDRRPMDSFHSANPQYSPAQTGMAMSTSRTNHTRDTYSSSSVTPHTGLERMNSTDSIMQQVSRSGDLHVPPPVIHYDYDSRSKATKNSGMKLNMHSIGIGDSDNSSFPGFMYNKSDDSYDADALNLQTPQDRPSSSAGDYAGNMAAIGEDAMIDHASVTSQCSQQHNNHTQSSAVLSTSSATSSKKVQHHLIMPLSGRLSIDGDNSSFYPHQPTELSPSEQDRYRQLAAQALAHRSFSRDSVSVEGQSSISSTHLRNPLLLLSDGLDPISLGKSSSANSNSNDRTRQNSYFDLSSPGSPSNQPLTGHPHHQAAILPPPKKSSASYFLHGASAHPAGALATSSSSSFQHSVPTRVDQRIHEIRDGIVYQKQKPHGPGKSTIGVFKGLSASHPAPLTSSQLHELNIDMTSKAQKQALPPLLLLGDASASALVSALNAPNSTISTKISKKKYQGPYKLDDRDIAGNISMSKSTTSLGQAGLTALQSAETLKKLQKELF